MEQCHKKVCIRVSLHSFLWHLKTFSKTLASQILVWNCQSWLHGCWFHFYRNLTKNNRSIINPSWLSPILLKRTCMPLINHQNDRSFQIQINPSQWSPIPLKMTRIHRSRFHWKSDFSSAHWKQPMGLLLTELIRLSKCSFLGANTYLAQKHISSPLPRKHLASLLSKHQPTHSGLQRRWSWVWVLHYILDVFGDWHSCNWKLIRSFTSFRLNFISKAHKIVASGFIERKKSPDEVAVDVKSALNEYNYIFEMYDMTKVFWIIMILNLSLTETLQGHTFWTLQAPSHSTNPLNVFWEEIEQEWSTVNDQLSPSNLCWNACGYNCVCMLSCEFSIQISQFTIDMRLYTGRFIMHCKNGKQASSYRQISLLMRPFQFFKTICEDLPHGHGHCPQNGHS